MIPSDDKYYVKALIAALLATGIYGYPLLYALLNVATPNAPIIQQGGLFLTLFFSLLGWVCFVDYRVYRLFHSVTHNRSFLDLVKIALIAPWVKG